jgi:outer membrane receptor protein involved in Fe transport
MIPKTGPMLLSMLVLAAGLMGSPEPVDAQSSQSTGEIHVVVFGVDGAPLEGVKVAVDGTDAIARTNADGGALLRAPAGTWRVTLEHRDRRGTATEVRVVEGMRTEVVAEFDAPGKGFWADVEAPEDDEEDDEDEEDDDEDEEDRGPPGTLSGKVVSSEEGKPVETARILVRGSTAEDQTGPDGRFSLTLPPGEWDISVIHPDFSTASRQEVEVKSNEETSVDIELTPAAVRLSAFRVAIPRIEGGTVQLMEERKESSAATEVMGAEEFSKTGDSTAAGALKRVTGLTVVGGKFVYVRGLGSRYSSTLLNGANLPSTEPEKRVVPLDLFPTSMLESITIQKTYTPDMPGDFGGGVVQMETRSYPSEFQANVGLSVGGATDTTFQDGQSYQGGSLDWLGIDDGTRTMPDEFERRTEGTELRQKNSLGQGNFTAGEIEELGEMLPNIYNVNSQTMMPNLSISGEIGDQFDLGGDTTAGFLFSASYDYSHDISDYEEKTVIDGVNGPTVQNEYDFYETNNEVVTNAILAGGIDFGENNRLKLTSLINRVTDDTVRTYEGFYNDFGDTIRVTRLRYQERQLMFHQLQGKHTFPGAQDFTVEWQYVYSQGQRDEPDRRDYRYNWEEDKGEYVFDGRALGNERLYSDLVDNTHDAKLNFSLPVGIWGGRNMKLKFGASFASKQREVDTRRFLWDSDTLSDEIATQRPEQIFSEENIGPDSAFKLTEATLATDNYSGGQITAAGYAMAEMPITERFKATFGARVEHSDQDVKTTALFEDKEISSNLKTTDILPSINLKYDINDEMLVRAAASRTVNRPNFRELSEARFSSVVGGNVFRGNPDLDRAQITHVDARYEWYPSRGESLSLGAFYKDFVDPIELSFRPAAQRLVRPFNIDGAQNFGVEFAARKKLGFLGEAMRDFYIAGNVSYIYSRIDIDPESEAGEILTNTERPLQGQSPYTVNLQFGYDNPESRTQATLLYNVSGPRIVEVGAYGIPDNYEQPFHSLDFTFSQKFDNDWKISVSADNLLNLPHTYEQGDITTYYELEGRSFSLGVSKGF